MRSAGVQVPVYYNDYYGAPSIDFETFRKSEHIAASVKQHDRLVLRDPSERPEMINRTEAIVRTFTHPAYLEAIRTGEPQHLAASNGLGWDKGIYPMVIHSTAGVLAAIEDVGMGGATMAASLSSGLHHARASHGSGFCTINSLAIGALCAAAMFESVAILDFDAHCGGGTQSILEENEAPNVFHFDLSINSFDSYFPNRQRSYLEIVRPPDYLAAVNRVLDRVRQTAPDLVLYNAGVDVFPALSRGTLLERERSVAAMTAEIGCRSVIVMAGGYGDLSTIVPLHLATLKAFSSVLHDNSFGELASHRSTRFGSDATTR